MRDANPGTVYLKDYRPPAYLINRTELHFELHAFITEFFAQQTRRIIRYAAQPLLHRLVALFIAGLTASDLTFLVRSGFPLLELSSTVFLRRLLFVGISRLLLRCGFLLRV